MLSDHHSAPGVGVPSPFIIQHSLELAQTALLVLLPAAARARIVAPDLLRSVARSREVRARTFRRSFVLES